MATLIFIACQLVYAQVWQKSEAIAQTVITTGYWTGGAIIGAYVFGKAWENIKTAR